MTVKMILILMRMMLMMNDDDENDVYDDSYLAVVAELLHEARDLIPGHLDVGGDVGD